MERIAANPRIYQRVEVPEYCGEPPRRAGVHKFPYSIIYAPKGDGILVVMAIAHDRREPQYWASRLVRD